MHIMITSYSEGLVCFAATTQKMRVASHLGPPCVQAWLSNAAPANASGYAIPSYVRQFIQVNLTDMFAHQVTDF